MVTDAVISVKSIYSAGKYRVDLLVRGRWGVKKSGVDRRVELVRGTAGVQNWRVDRDAWSAISSIVYNLFFKGGKCLSEVFKKIVFEFMYSINVYVWLLLFFISEFELIG